MYNANFSLNVGTQIVSFGLNYTNSIEYRFSFPLLVGRSHSVRTWLISVALVPQFTARKAQLNITDSTMMILQTCRIHHPEFIALHHTSDLVVLIFSILNSCYIYLSIFSGR